MRRLPHNVNKKPLLSRSGFFREVLPLFLSGSPVPYRATVLLSLYGLDGQLADGRIEVVDVFANILRQVGRTS